MLENFLICSRTLLFFKIFMHLFSKYLLHSSASCILSFNKCLLINYCVLSDILDIKKKTKKKDIVFCYGVQTIVRKRVTEKE